jgi:hypothetical protein
MEISNIFCNRFLSFTDIWAAAIPNNNDTTTICMSFSVVKVVCKPFKNEIMIEMHLNFNKQFYFENNVLHWNA